MSIDWMFSRRNLGRMLAAALLAGAILGAFGCGPIRSTQRIGQASVALERARVVESYKKAPYEYFSARYYLHKAKEEWGYSDFEASFDYAEEAKEAAESARLKAKEDPWEDPIEGRNKTYDLRAQETITADPEDIHEAEGLEESGGYQPAEDSEGSEQSEQPPETE